MSNPAYTAGPFSALFVGNSGQSTPLTRIDLTTTGAFEFYQTVPREEFIHCTNSYEQSGNKEITLSLAFMSDDLNARKLANGLPLSSTTGYGTSVNQQYAIFLVAPGSTGNLYIPTCESLNQYRVSRSKSDPTNISIQFRFQAPDLNTNLYYENTLSALQIIMNGQYPL